MASFQNARVESIKVDQGGTVEAHLREESNPDSQGPAKIDGNNAGFDAVYSMLLAAFIHHETIHAEITDGNIQWIRIQRVV